VKNNWSKAKGVLHAVRASEQFSTIRDRIGDSYIAKERLRVLKPLGQGAFATVELAELAAEGAGSRAAKPKQVAVKTLKPELLEKQGELDIFLDEIKLLRKMQHRCARPHTPQALPACTHRQDRPRGCRHPRSSASAGERLCQCSTAALERLHRPHLLSHPRPQEHR
jgi:serine/threonine protein kinase